eukprot:CAMPEP_0204428288 /NCGR_PEP_ID=MMETSP0470-20130426/57424_1 /ASSEMBLY_ACC=CAM_ASM_000385 /TAXON_ID=2969 /ORGANISM="Oxyrrhis marina" /LENGTH=116 /DNA_ID=CAMNT_0051426187 /DNA_START=415 /DNA_END=762 /DNA_ORIENTATION=+
MGLGQLEIECPFSSNSALLRYASTPLHTHPLRRDHRARASAMLVPKFPVGASDNSCSHGSVGAGQPWWLLAREGFTKAQYAQIKSTPNAAVQMFRTVRHFGENRVITLLSMNVDGN